jgi:sodium/bile acid cotransporter 7
VRPFRLDPFVAALLAAAILASVFPATGQVYEVLLWISRVAIGLLFFLYGVRLSTSETWHGLRNWRLQSSILLTTFVAFPLAGLALSHTTGPVLGKTLAAGLLLLCLVPTTVQSNVVFTRIAGGDTAAAVVAASLSNLIGVFLTPALVAVLMSGKAEVDANAVVRIVLQLLAPFLLGQAVRRWLVRWVTSNDSWLKRVDQSSVVLVVFVAFSAGASSAVWAQTTAWAVLGLVAVSLALLAVATGWTWGLGRLLGMSRPELIALVFCGTNKSLASGLPIAWVLFSGPRVALLVLPLMVYHQLQVVVGGAMAARLGRSLASSRAERIGPVSDDVPPR